jgi:hypothetical protein
VLHLDDVALELVDPLDVRLRPPAEDVGPDLLDVPVDRLDDEQVVVDDLVGHGVQHGGRAEGEHLRLRLELAAQAGHRGVPAVPDGDDDGLGDEDHDRTGLDDVAALLALVALDVPDGAQGQEQHVVVTVHLRALP